MENENKIGFFKRIGIAITSPKDYNKIAKDKKRKAIGIYFVISLIYSIIMIILLVLLYKLIITSSKEYITSLPQFSISKNGFISEMEKPIQFYDEENGLLIYIYSKENLEEIKTKNVDKIYSANVYLLVGTDAFSIKESEGDIMTMTFPELFGKEEVNTIDEEYLQETEEYIEKEEEVIQEEFNITSENINELPEVVEKMLPNVTTDLGEERKELNNETLLSLIGTIEKSNLKILIFAIMFLVMLLIIFIAFIINGLIYSILAVIISAINKKKLSFSELYNIAMYSLLVPTLLYVVTIFIRFDYWGIIYWIIVAFYMQVAISNYDNNEKNDKEEIIEVKDDNNK